MKFLDFRKYFFANTAALWLYCFIFLCIFIKIYICPNADPESKDFLIPFIFVIIAKSFLILICIFICMILEILIRKFIIEKRFPNFKINLKFKIPKAIITIYNVIFSIGFSLASVGFVIALFCLIYFAIDTSHPLFG